MAERIATAPHETVKWQVPTEFEGIMAYNPRHDIQDFLDLAALQGKIPPQEFVQRQILTINRTKRQLEKTVGERFKVRSSQIQYSIDNGMLKSPDYVEPVIQRYEKAQRFLAENGSAETERESAEVEGIRQIEKIFAEGKLRENEKIIVVSPKGPEGTLYGDNHFDVYELKDGKIVMTRYHSTHNYLEFFKAAQKASPNRNWPQTDQLNAAYFLQRPLVTSLSTDQILETFAIDLDTQLENLNQQIKEDCLSFINYYIRTLLEDPLNIDEIKKTINTIYNVADESEKKHQNNAHSKTKQATVHHMEESIATFLPFASIKQAINYYAMQPVRPVSFGCPGGQKGFSINQSPILRSLSSAIGARSVVDFAPFATINDEKVEDFQCPGTKKDGTKCTYIVRAYSGTTKCPECGMEATCS